MKKEWIACLAVALVGLVAQSQGAGPRVFQCRPPDRGLLLPGKARNDVAICSLSKRDVHVFRPLKLPPGDLHEMQGKWTPTTFYFLEQLWPEDVLPGFSVIFKGKECMVMVGPMLLAKAVGVSLDPSKTPKEYEHVIPNGPDKGKIIPGIYELDGDNLKISVADLDGGRPKDYSVPEGKSGRAVMILRRAK